MNTVTGRVEPLREVEEISEANHFSQKTLDMLRERTEGSHLLITGRRGLGGKYSRISEFLIVQKILDRIRYPLTHC